MSKEKGLVKKASFKEFMYGGDIYVSACSTCKHMKKHSVVRNNEEDNVEMYGYSYFCPETGSLPTRMQDDDLVEFFNIAKCTGHAEK